MQFVVLRWYVGTTVSGFFSLCEQWERSIQSTEIMLFNKYTETGMQTVLYLHGIAFLMKTLWKKATINDSSVCNRGEKIRFSQKAFHCIKFANPCRSLVKKA